MENLERLKLFNNIYRRKTVLITGNTGFKGSWLALWLFKMGANAIGYSKDFVSDPSHFSLLNLPYKTVFSDILSVTYLNQILKRYQPDIIFHLAAQSLVIESYKKPVETYKTNIIGTLNVLEAARRCESVKAFINVTTDKVYENNDTGVSFEETDALGGYDMYSSSKACSEILSRSYLSSFKDKGFLLATARAGNVIGGGDWAKDRLLPDIVRATIKKKKCLIRNPQAVRPWQHVLEPLSGYLILGQNLLEGKSECEGAWNFGPSEKRGITVFEMVQHAQKAWPELRFTLKENEKCKHEISLLGINSNKAKKLLHWKNTWGQEDTLEKTIQWYKDYYFEKKISTEKNLIDFMSEAKIQKQIWTQ